MNREMKWRAFVFVVLIATSVLMLNLIYSNTLASIYNDNTTVITRLNVTNKAPVVYNVNLYDSNKPGDIILEQGTTHTVVCNATVNDTNGYGDISNVNATLYKYTEHGPGDAQDNNYKYENGSCTQYNTENVITGYYTCHFLVWYYANNGTWRCNVTAIDLGNAVNDSSDENIIDPLFALNLSNDTIDYGELEPLNISQDKVMNITNFGNMNLTIAVRAYGKSEGDGWAMNCTTGNISLAYERYSVDSGLAWGSMTPVASSFTNIAGLTVYQKVDDGDTGLINSTNSTYWKIKAPLGTKGVCNGTLEFSAVNT